MNPTLLCFYSVGCLKQIPLSCRWSGVSKELSPRVPRPLLFDVLTSLALPPKIILPSPKFLLSTECRRTVRVSCTGPRVSKPPWKCRQGLWKTTAYILREGVVLVAERERKRGDGCSGCHHELSVLKLLFSWPGHGL